MSAGRESLRTSRRSAARSGRTGVLSATLFVAFLLLGYAALRVLELLPSSSPVVPEQTDRPAEQPALEAWSARVTLGEAQILARLLPLHGDAALEEFRAGALRTRYGLPEGAPWRLYLTLAAPSAVPVLVSAARVADGLEPFAALASAPAGPDPVHALLAAAPGVLEVGRARPMVLWGRLASDAPELELTSAEHTGRAVLAREEGKDEPRWYAGHALPREETLEQEVERLARELDREKARRAERELAFLEFSRLLGELPGAKELGLAPAPETKAPPPDPEEEARFAAEEKARARAAELGRSLAVLMRLEGLRGLDLLEAGTLQPGPPSAIGPVVFRCLDERGHLAGSLRAERLRLEGSLAAHTLTVVLEQGYESRGGDPAPFADGVRRITLVDVDPGPWQAECPELFEATDLAGDGDDGRWPLGDVRRELNRLLALDTHLGWYRLHSLGGVSGVELVDVQLAELQPDGRLARRVFADHLTLALEDGSVVLELRDGAFVLGEEKRPFRDGRHRIVLPGVDAAAWRAAALPGFSAPPAREKPAQEAPSEGQAGSSGG